jgi:mannose/fructose/N-acetylgalactosamine-specific phosphotransferase system component IIB
MEKLLPKWSQQQIMNASTNFKTAAQTQYPNFDLFPYSTSDMKVQYDTPDILTVYIKGVDSLDSQNQALLELSAYLEKSGLSIQNLKDKGVQIDYKELPQDYSVPQVSE